MRVTAVNRRPKEKRGREEKGGCPDYPGIRLVNQHTPSLELTN